MSISIECMEFFETKSRIKGSALILRSLSKMKYLKSEEIENLLKVEMILVI